MDRSPTLAAATLAPRLPARDAGRARHGAKSKGSGCMNDVQPMVEAKGLAQGPGALAGIKIVDLTRVLGGPYCTQMLGDHGADIVKVEPPQGDETRGWGPPF